MRLTYIARRYPPAMGGVESFIRDLARELATRHEVTVLAQRIDDGPTGRLSESLQPPPLFEEFTDGGVLVRPVHAPAARRLMMAPLISMVLPVFRRYAYGRSRALMSQVFERAMGPVMARAAHDPEVVHVWGHDLGGAAAVAAGRRLRVPVAITPFAHRGQWGNDRASLRAYRGADAVVALTETDAAHYVELGKPPAQVRVAGVCSPGVDGEGASALRQRHRISGPVVLFVGVRRPYKGHDVLLAAVTEVRAAVPDATFVFVGPGEPIPATPGVIDAGAVDDRELSAWYGAADVFSLPSAGEIFPVTMLEAWSAGVPVVTSDIPTLVELVTRSGGGVTAPASPGALAGAILRLLQDPARAREMGRAGRHFWATEATVAVVAGRHEELYAELAGRRASER